MPRSAKRIFSIIVAVLVLAGGYFLANNIFNGEASDPSAASYDTSGKFMLDVIDCGQGDSILAKTPDGFYILVDAGDTDAKAAVLGELKKQNIDHIDLLVITHPHADHIGSMQDVVDSIPVKKVLLSGAEHTTQLYENLLTDIQQKDIPQVLAVPGKTYTFGQLTADVLGPLDDYKDLNDTSVVLRLKYGNNTFLLMGDAEKDAEKDMLKKYPDLHADMLKVGHHGSETSTTDKFLKAVDPKFSAISVGNDNDYNHPNPDTVNRLKKNGIAVYQTNLSGCIRFYSDGKTLDVKTEK